MVVTASSWERNLQKLWALKYPEAYSARVGEKKVRLAAEIASAFAELGFRATATRLLTDTSGALIGDVDVAVFDDREALLAVMELKWFIASAESYEVRRNDAEVQAGTAQARASAAFVPSQPADAMALLFPGRTPTIPRSVQPLVIVRGHLPTIAVLTDDVPIVGYDVLVAYLAQVKPGIRLPALLHDVTGFLDRIGHRSITILTTST
jgi:hypothetical protein